MYEMEEIEQLNWAESTKVVTSRDDSYFETNGINIRQMYLCNFDNMSALWAPAETNLTIWLSESEEMSIKFGLETFFHDYVLVAF